jgi:uncharacterized membrane protein
MNEYPFDHRGDPLVLYHHGGPGALSWTIFALQLLLLVALAALLASAFAGSRWGRRPAPAGGPARSADPLEVVRLRYARGEIDRDQYLLATRDLGGHAEGEAPPTDAT